MHRIGLVVSIFCPLNSVHNEFLLMMLYLLISSIADKSVGQGVGLGYDVVIRINEAIGTYSLISQFYRINELYSGLLFFLSA